MPPRVEYQYKSLGICPRCGAPGAIYEYVIEGPLDETRETARVIARVRCEVCGYTLERKIVFPVKALNLLKMLLVPEARPAVEKLYLLYKIRIAGETGAEA